MFSVHMWLAVELSLCLVAIRSWQHRGSLAIHKQGCHNWHHYVLVAALSLVRLPSVGMHAVMQFAHVYRTCMCHDTHFDHLPFLVFFSSFNFFFLLQNDNKSTRDITLCTHILSHAQKHTHTHEQWALCTATTISIAQKPCESMKWYYCDAWRSFISLVPYALRYIRVCGSTNAYLNAVLHTCVLYFMKNEKKKMVDGNHGTIQPRNVRYDKMHKLHKTNACNVHTYAIFVWAIAIAVMHPCMHSITECITTSNAPSRQMIAPLNIKQQRKRGNKQCAIRAHTHRRNLHTTRAFVYAS